MSWRFERSAGLTRLLDVVIKTFGVDNIDIRYVVNNLTGKKVMKNKWCGEDEDEGEGKDEGEDEDEDEGEDEGEGEGEGER